MKALKRARIRERDGFVCFYCREPSTTIDHLLATSAGGTNDESNLVGCCRECNLMKGNMSARMFVSQHLRARLRQLGKNGRKRLVEEAMARLVAMRPDLGFRERKVVG